MTYRLLFPLLPSPSHPTATIPYPNVAITPFPSIASPLFVPIMHSFPVIYPPSSSKRNITNINVHTTKTRSELA